MDPGEGVRPNGAPEDLERLRGFAAKAVARASAGGLIAHVLESARDLLPADRAVLFVFERDPDLLRGWTGDEEPAGSVPARDGRVIARVFGTGESEAVDLADLPEGGRVLPGLEGTRHVLAAPVVASRPIGVLAAARGGDHGFGARELSLLSLIGGQCALLMENARLQTSLEQQGQQLETFGKLEESARRKNEFVSVLAHELRNPMATLMGWGETLRTQWETTPDHKREHILEVITAEIARLSRLVNDVLDVSQIESGTLTYDRHPLSLPEFVDELLVTHPSLRDHHAVDTRLPPDLPFVEADADRLRQVLLNLLLNAIRYSPAGSSVRVRAEVSTNGTGSEVRVSVEDEGIGVPPEHCERVFSKFAMLPRPEGVEKGTGLGLFITKGIVEAHGGRIWCESKAGSGATFHFTLPVATQPRP
ncbi:MAG: ATP-binding protein [Actinomycetota bacterium]